jgi:carboxyl-terminal processing protease
MKKILGIVLLVAVFIVGFNVARVYPDLNLPPLLQSSFKYTGNLEDKPPLDMFWYVWDRLHQLFIDKDKLDNSQLLYGAIKGMVEATNDPYSNYLDPKQTKNFNDALQGSFEGIGTEIGKRDSNIVIIAPLKNTPAERAGLKPGDIILKIDNVSTFNMSLDEAVSRIKGKKGTVVTLNILREGETEPFDLKITRDIIIIPVMDLKYVGSKKNIAHLSIYSFNEKLITEFDKAAKKIVNDKINEIILDLRNNPGGILEIAVKIASYFIDPQTVVVKEAATDSGLKEYKTQGSPILKDKKMVILINNGSASASEILAGALRDIKNVQIIGEKSFGKGTVQAYEILPDRSSLKITIAKWFTPKDLSIQDNGIKPDIEVKMSKEDLKNNIDPQLDKAIEILSK